MARALRWLVAAGLLCLLAVAARAGQVAKDEVNGSFRIPSWTAPCSTAGIHPTIEAAAACWAAKAGSSSCNVAGFPPGPPVPYEVKQPAPVWSVGMPNTGTVEIIADCSVVAPPYNGAAAHVVSKGWSRSTVAACPVGTTDSGDGTATPCVCPAGDAYNPTTQTCEKDCSSSAMQPMTSGYFDYGTTAAAGPPLLGCRNGCEAIFDGVAPAGSALIDGVKHYFAQGDYVGTGAACTEGTELPELGDGMAEQPAEDSCSEGKVKGTVNGKTVCVTSGTGESDSESETKATEKTTISTENLPDGTSIETTSTTKCDASGNCTKTTSIKTTGPDGSQTIETETTGGGADGESDDGEEPTECERNPSAAGCGGEAAPVTGLREAGTDTMELVIAARVAQLQAAPIFAAMGGFLSVSEGGACPTFSWFIPYIDANVEMNQFCLEWALQAYLIMRLAVLFAAGFFAFRVAVE